MKENFKFIIKLGLILFLIVSVSTLALSLVNFVTKDIIAQKNIQLQDNARKNVLSEADRFELLNKTIEKDDSIGDIYTAYSGNDTVGYCISVSVNGYGGLIDMIVGINEDLSVSGVNIISMSETAGLGANAQKEEFLSQYKNKTSDIKVVKSSGNESNSINAISGATITSKAVTGGVNKAIETAKAVKEVSK